MRRLTSVVLSLTLTGLSAGLAPYSAWGQVRVQAGAAASASRGLGTPVVAPTSLGAAPFAPSLPVSVTLSATLPLSPAPALQAAVSGSAAHAVPAAGLQAAARLEPSGAVAPAAFTPSLTQPSAQAAAFSPAAAVTAAPNAAAPAAAAVEGAARAGSGRKVAAESAATSFGTLFDGSAMRPTASVFGAGTQAAGRARPALNRAVEESAQPAPESAPAPAAAPLLEGRLDVSKYKLAWDLRLRRAAALTAHYGLMAAVPVILGVGLGLVPLAAGAAALGLSLVVERFETARANGVEELTEGDLRATRDLLLRHKRGEALTASEQATLETRAAPFEQLLTWAEGTVDYLTGRLGLDPQSAPRVWIDESSPDLHWAASVGGKLDKSGAIYMGVGFVLRPLERAVGVLAHEMGHLFFGDKGKFRERLRMHGGASGGFKTGMRDAGVATGAAALAHALMTGFALADPTFLLWGLASAAAALASAAAALLAGLAATRQEELRADHFSAWLTDGAWLAAFLTEEAGRGREPRGLWERWKDHVLSTHPAWETRVERLARYVRPEALREAVLPVSDSFWGLSGETQAVVRGADATLADALAARAKGTYDFRLYQGMDGALVVRAHPVMGARLDAAPDRAAAALIASVLADRFPGARVESVRSAAHPAVETLKESALGRELLKELAAEPIAVRWEVGAPGAARAALVLSGARPEIVLNWNVYWKASPKAQAAALAHELFHYKAWRKFRALGAPWLVSGGLEFEGLAQGVGYRVFAELGGAVSDDVETPSGPLFLNGLGRWARSTPVAEADYLREHGYSSVLKLSSLRARSGEELALELGEPDAALVEANLSAAWSYYESELRAERVWAAAHPGAYLEARFLKR